MPSDSPKADPKPGDGKEPDRDPPPPSEPLPDEDLDQVEEQPS